ncbi:DUF4190 domain-containing protein [Corynebacterium camporealensis]
MSSPFDPQDDKPNGNLPKYGDGANRNLPSYGEGTGRSNSFADSNNSGSDNNAGNSGADNYGSGNYGSGDSYGSAGSYGSVDGYGSGTPGSYSAPDSGAAGYGGDAGYGAGAPDQQGYNQQPVYDQQPGYEEPVQKSKMAVAAFIFGLLCIVAGFAVMSFIPGIIGVILAIVALVRNRKKPREARRTWMSVTGLVLSIMGILWSIVALFIIGVLLEDMGALECLQLEDPAAQQACMEEAVSGSTTSESV